MRPIFSLEGERLVPSSRVVVGEPDSVLSERRREMMNEILPVDQTAAFRLGCASIHRLPSLVRGEVGSGLTEH